MGGELVEVGLEERAGEVYGPRGRVLGQRRDGGRRLLLGELAD